MRSLVPFYLACVCICNVVWAATDDDDIQLSFPIGPPQPPPSYMVDNQAGNQHHAAPDKGLLNGPAISWQNLTFIRKFSANTPSGITARSKEGDPCLSSLNDEFVENDGFDVDIEAFPEEEPPVQHLNLGSRATSYWLPNVAHGVMPFASGGYKFYRNVKDYGAKGDGSSDDTVAINKAITDGNRCGINCGSSSTLGALIYFPAGTYVISSPIIQ
ncbi:hypothetical protein ABW21_db0207045 [Orbilia brochopaga]|nr:hypothetical protein ABW21_db0207045 [Drechslerella brochopaga]